MKRSHEEDSLVFTPAATGWHPIVVYRPFGTNSGTGVTYSLFWSTSQIVGVPGAAGPAELAFEGAAPNPMLDRTLFEFSLAAPGHARLDLYDLGGRRVRRLADGTFEAGRLSVPWDGTGDDGARVGAGLYWARFEAGGRSFTKRVTVVR